jgi:GNAT superfamily N-acetyltransferase
MKSEPIIRPMKQEDAPMISAAFTALGWHKPLSQYERYHEEQELGKRVVLVAFLNEAFSGYGNVVWTSDYPPFRQERIPEIADLNVLPQFRRRGIATAIMDRAEALISEHSDTAGLGVGLYPDYGAAQRMYVLRGYVPDGLGITFRNHHVAAGEEVRVDDDLVLWFTKALR